MMHRAPGLRMIGLSILAAFGLMAFTATAAQAEGEFKIGGKTFAELGIEEESFAGSLSGTYGLLTVPSLGYEINCGAMDVLEGKILLKGVADVTFKLLKCTALVAKTKEELSTCTVDSFTTTKLKGSVLLHEGKVFLLFEPVLENGALMLLKISGGECVLAKEIETKGSFVGEIGAEGTVPKLVLSDKATSATLGDHISLALIPTELFADGTLQLELTGKFAGSKWGAI